MQASTPIQTRSFGETTLVSFRGACTGDAGALEARVEEVVDRGCRRLVVDLSDVGSMDSEVIRTLFRASLAMEDVSGKVWLVHPPRLARFLGLIGAAEAFVLAGSVADALRAAGAEGRAMLLNMGASASATVEPVQRRRRRLGLRGALGAAAAWR